MAKNQYKITCPKTGKHIPVNRQVYYALKDSQEINAGIQKSKGQEIQSVSKSLTNKIYKGETMNIFMSYTFDESGEINRHGDPKKTGIELQGKYADLPQDMQDILLEALKEQILCQNQLLLNKGEDMKEEMKTIIQPAA